MAARLAFLLLSCGETSAAVLADTSDPQQANQQEDGSGKTSYRPPYPVQECHQFLRSPQTTRQVQSQKALAGKKTWSDKEPVVLVGEEEKQAGHQTAPQAEYMKVENQVLVVDPAECAAETHGKGSLQVVRHTAVFQSCETD